MPEVRLIDANALTDKLDVMISKAILYDTQIPYALIRERIAEQPTIEAEPVRHGRWIEDTSRGSLSIYCSYCGSYKETICPSDYCPSCGALMDLRTPTEAQHDEADSVMMGGADNG